MSHIWTEREVAVLTHAARPGRSSKDILAAYNAAHGTRCRTRDAVTCKLTKIGIHYGRGMVPWSADEQRLLLAMAEQSPLWDIQAALLAECGSTRTLDAIRVRLITVGHSLIPSERIWISTPRLARELGCSLFTVTALINRGALRCSGEPQNRYVRREWVLEMIDREPMRFNPAIMPRGQFRNRVELRQREGRYLTIDQAAAAARVSPNTINRACLGGELTAHRVRRGRDGGQARWWIRAADLTHWQARMSNGKAA